MMENLKKIHILLVFIYLFIGQFFYAQKTSRADRFFNKGDYINAAKYYELQLENDYSKKAIKNIATSYYNIFEYRDAAYYLKELFTENFEDNDKPIDNKFNFMYYQVQSALGNYEKGFIYLKKYYTNLNKEFNIKEAVNLIESIKLKSPDFTIKKLNVNSSFSDFGAVKFRDSLYFTSDRNLKLFDKSYNWTHNSYLNIYSVKIDKELDTLGTPIKLPINSTLHDGNFCFSKDGNTIYISRSNTNKGKQVFDTLKKNNIHLYKATKKDGKWSKLKKLPFNTLGDSYEHPTLSANEDKLYFSSNRLGGFGSFDIYYVTINDTIYGEPKNLGSLINTPNREQFPYISKKGNLFFSSNGHLGLGMLDIFVSENKDGNFTEPINLGFPINSKYDDFNLNYYNSKQGFFASNRNQKQDDIFSFNQIGEIFLRPYTTLFEVRDFVTKEFVPNTHLTLIDKKGKEVFNKILKNKTSQKIDLLPSIYKVNIVSNGYLDKEKIISVLEKQNQKHVFYLKKKMVKVISPPSAPKPKNPMDELLKEKGISKDLKKENPEKFKLLTDTKGPPVIEKNGKLYFELPPIYFDFDMWNISEESKLILNELAKKLERYPNIYLKISAYTDSRGTVMYNQILSERRAESTRNYLALETFINARRLKFEGYGESKPVIPCEIPSQCTEEEHQLNRRSEFEIIKY